MIDVPGEPPIADDQLQLHALGPTPGERWRNKNTRGIVTVLSVDQRSYCWVTMRVAGTVQTLTLARFERAFESYQPTNGRQ